MYTRESPPIEGPEPPAAYEPPRLWEYGRLRVDTAGDNAPGNQDFAINYSVI